MMCGGRTSRGSATGDFVYLIGHHWFILNLKTMVIQPENTTASLLQLNGSGFAAPKIPFNFDPNIRLFI